MKKNLFHLYSNIVVENLMWMFFFFFFLWSGAGGALWVGIKEYWWQYGNTKNLGVSWELDENIAVNMEKSPKYICKNTLLMGHFVILDCIHHH